MAGWPGDDIYRSLPVVIVDSWNETTLSEQRMRQWRDELAPFFEQRDKRAFVLEQLMSDFWLVKLKCTRGKVCVIDR